VAALPQRYLAYLVAGVANPVIARAEPAALAAAIRRYARYQVLGPGAVAIGLGVMAPEVTGLLLGSRWAEAAPLIRLMGLSTAMLALGTVIGGSLVSRGEVKPLFAFHAAKLAGTVLGVMAGLRYGAMGVAGGFLVATTASVLMGLRLVEARLGVAGVLRACLGPGAVVAGAAVAAWASRGIALAAGAPPWAVLAGAGAAYVAFLAGTAVIAFEDVRRDLGGVRRPRFVRPPAGLSGP
jgi:O-antigen/teichoic acid export membrane protein